MSTNDQSKNEEFVKNSSDKNISQLLTKIMSSRAGKIAAIVLGGAAIVTAGVAAYQYFTAGPCDFLETATETEKVIQCRSYLQENAENGDSLCLETCERIVACNEALISKNMLQVKTFLNKYQNSADDPCYQQVVQLQDSLRQQDSLDCIVAYKADSCAAFRAYLEKYGTTGKCSMFFADKAKACGFTDFAIPMEYGSDSCIIIIERVNLTAQIEAEGDRKKELELRIQKFENALKQKLSTSCSNRLKSLIACDKVRLEDNCAAYQDYILNSDGNCKDEFYRRLSTLNCPCIKQFDDIYNAYTQSERCQACEEFLSSCNTVASFEKVAEYCVNVCNTAIPCADLLDEIEAQRDNSTKCTLAKRYEGLMRANGDTDCLQQIRGVLNSLGCSSDGIDCEQVLKDIIQLPRSSRCKACEPYLRSCSNINKYYRNLCQEEVTSRNPVTALINGQEYNTVKMGPLQITNQDVQVYQGETYMTWMEAIELCSPRRNWRLPCESEIDNYYRLNFYSSDAKAARNMYANRPSGTVSYWLGTERSDTEAYVVTFYGRELMKVEVKDKRTQLPCRCVQANEDYNSRSSISQLPKCFDDPNSFNFR